MNSDQKGFAHVTLVLIVVVLGVVGFAGYRVIKRDKPVQNVTPLGVDDTSKTPTPIDAVVKDAIAEEKANTPGSVESVFSQQDPAIWPAGQLEAYVGVGVDNSRLSQVKKVEWYLNNLEPTSLKYSLSSPTVGSLFQFNWSLKGLESGTYRWLVKVYDTDGNYQLTKSHSGNSYIDMVVDNNKPGKVSGKFVQPDKTSWVPTQGVAYIGLNVDESKIKEVSKVEWYVNDTGSNSLRYTQSKPSVGSLFQYDWPLARYEKGTYRWIAKVYDQDGNFQLVKNNLGYPYVDMTVQ